ncbi:hypothetical protein FHS96_001019 [Sphingomonas zeicaulis]|uniref:cysteine protease StiP family protein n=1 Tax=Sphingomonas zeicaulis TaxID=1632740 RepID=UPI003D1B8402
MVGFPGSYDPADVTFLMKPVALAPTDIDTKERLIQSGRRHYSEMLSAESLPDPIYIELYQAALARNGARLAADVAGLALALAERAGDGREVVIVSLARAGTPIGALLARALRRQGRSAPHYSVSIIRDRGIDRVALAHIASRHAPEDIVFVDGWTGKGAISTELQACLAERPFGVAPFLTVIADPAGRADLAATEDDYLIASGLLNAIVSGLVSRSILNDSVVGPGDFHACVTYPHFAPHDVTRAFIETIDALATEVVPTLDPRDDAQRAETAAACDALVETLMARLGIADRNRVKPGIAEATRAVLRRVPDRLFVRDPADPDVAHLIHLAGGRGVPVDRLDPDCRFRAVAIIKSLGSE